VYFSSRRCHARCLVPGTFNSARYVCSDDTQSGYIEAPDSLGSMFGIFVLSSMVEVIVVAADILVLASSVGSFPFPHIYLIKG